MLIFYGENPDGVFRLPEPLSVEINCEIGVPADDMTAVFCRPLPELWKIYACKEGAFSPEDAKEKGLLIFAGIVDEQIRTESGGRCRETVCARSPAALALDNECEPGQYTDPSLDVIFRMHLSRFGIKTEELDIKCRTGIMNIPRGFSHYAAAERFCRMFLSSVPRIDSIGVFRPNAYIEGKPISFGGRTGIRVLSVTKKLRRCAVISKVYADTDSKPAVVINEEALGNGIIRERRINLSDSATGTLSDADAVIAKGQRDHRVTEILCAGALFDILGREAVSDASDIVMTIVKTKYIFSGGTEKTAVALTLKKEAV